MGRHVHIRVCDTVGEPAEAASSAPCQVIQSTPPHERERGSRRERARASAGECG